MRIIFEKKLTQFSQTCWLTQPSFDSNLVLFVGIGVLNSTDAQRCIQFHLHASRPSTHPTKMCSFAANEKRKKRESFELKALKAIKTLNIFCLQLFFCRRKSLHQFQEGKSFLNKNVKLSRKKKENKLANDKSFM